MAMNGINRSVNLIILLDKIKKQLEKDAKPDILIIGDTPLDIFWICQESRKNFHQDHVVSVKQSQFDVIYEIRRPGSVYAKAKLLKESGFQVSLITCLGDDETGSYIRNKYLNLGINLISPVIGGASFQRHYMLNRATGSDLTQGQFNTVYRINHEPAYNDEFPNIDIDKHIYDKIREAICQSKYLLINDTQKGTLSWDDRKKENGVQPGVLTAFFIEQVSTLKKEITTLDSRKSIRYYKDMKTKFLTSSTYEVAVSLSNPGSMEIRKGQGAVLEKGLLYKLFKEYPDIENWALTRGANGVQLGIKDQDEGTINCCTQPAVVDPDSAADFTPHCGDFFDAGIVIGLYAGLSPVECITFGSLLGGLQARKTNAEVISAEDIINFDSGAGFINSNNNRIDLTDMFSVKEE
jgi:bifunctional ADP-heptose synthase (sugar kinase/adenylyltransferase)